MVVLLLVLAACTTCDCLAPGGPRVDMAAATPEVARVFAGPWTGTVTDAPGDERDGVHFEPCAIADQPFELAFEVAAANCHDCTAGTFPLTGTLAVGDAPLLALGGSVELWSQDDGLSVWQVVLDAPDDAAFPYETVDVLQSDESALDRVEVRGLEWARRQSADDEAPAVWEVCDLG